MSDLGLSCDCGTIKGIVKRKEAASGNRVICCCDDCQKFANLLGGEEKTLDEQGGTDICQVCPAAIEITGGAEQIRCLKHSEKGTFRWYAGCCNTPIGNTVAPSMPFVGIIHRFWADKGLWDEVVGPSSARVQTRHALYVPEGAPAPNGFPLSVTLKIMLKILGWKLSGKGRPNPFFDAEGAPLSEPQVHKKELS